MSCLSCMYPHILGYLLLCQSQITVITFLGCDCHLHKTYKKQVGLLSKCPSGSLSDSIITSKVLLKPGNSSAMENSLSANTGEHCTLWSVHMGLIQHFPHGFGEGNSSSLFRAATTCPSRSFSPGCSQLPLPSDFYSQHWIFHASLTICAAFHPREPSAVFHTPGFSSGAAAELPASTSWAD